MRTASMATNGGLRPNDPRWYRVARVGEIIAVTLEIEEHIKFIIAHALHAHPLEVAVNLRQIHKEAKGMSDDTTKIKRHLWQLQALMEEDIYRDHAPEKKKDEMGNGNKNSKQTTKTKAHRPRKLKAVKPKYRGNGERKG